MNSTISLPMSERINTTGPITTARTTMTRNMDQKVCILLLVFLSSFLNGLCRQTAKKKDKRNGAVTPKRYFTKKKIKPK